MLKKQQVPQPIIITRKGKNIDPVIPATPAEAPKSQLRLDLDATLERLQSAEQLIADLQARIAKLEAGGAAALDEGPQPMLANMYEQTIDKSESGRLEDELPGLVQKSVRPRA